MSYPEQKYLGEAGEVSAVLRRAGQPHDLLMGAGARLHYLATGDTTGGGFGLYRCDFPGPPSVADPHFHASITESFYILLGTIELYDGKAWVNAKRGDFLFVPAGGIHGFRNCSGDPASMLLLYTPGAPREAFFEEFARWAAGQVPSRDQMMEFMLSHDTHPVQALPAGRRRDGPPG